MNLLHRCLGQVLFPLALIFCSLTVPATGASVSVRIAPQYGLAPGDTFDLKVIMTSTQPLGGVDFTVKYVDSAFHFISVSQDSGLHHWEYFASFLGTLSHSVRFVSIADIANGPIHPSTDDFYPNGIIARLRFSVAPTWVKDSTELPFNFYWGDCGDNASSNRLGDSLILIHKIMNADGTLIWDETNNQAFPEANRIPHVGVPDSCLVGSSGLQFILDFRNGIAGNFYVCGDADGSGSVNVSDAAYLISYIFAGGPPPLPLIAGDADCNSNVNISDAVALLSYIFSTGSPPCQCGVAK